MNGLDDNEPDGGGDDVLAAEYVVGVLPADERRAAAERLEREPGFARLVDRWEVNLSPMASAYPPVEPPAAVKATIDRRLFTRPTHVAKSGFWSSLNFWRGLAVAALAALLLYIAVPYIAPSSQAPAERYVASLAPHDSDVHYFVVVDETNGDIGLSHVTGARADDRDFELWLIEGGNAPRSLGVIPVGANVHLSLAQEIWSRLAQGAILAISLEPAGGSTTGQPTGPVVAQGDLVSI
ncbi:MAG: anti-sigma factor [Rhizobiaceae bacterium]